MASLTEYEKLQAKNLSLANELLEEKIKEQKIFNKIQTKTLEKM